MADSVTTTARRTFNSAIARRDSGLRLEDIEDFVTRAKQAGVPSDTLVFVPGVASILRPQKVILNSIEVEALTEVQKD